MRRQPRQQRSQEVAIRIEQATLALLREQGFAALNTNAIAARAGVGIKSLYHLYPNKEAIICRLAMDWLAAVCEAQAAIRQQADDWPQTLAMLDQALDALDERFVGYGALWQAMDLIPALHGVEQEHERGQLAFWHERLRHFWLPLARTRAHHPDPLLLPDGGCGQAVRQEQGRLGIPSGCSIATGCSNWWRAPSPSRIPPECGKRCPP